MYSGKQVLVRATPRPAPCPSGAVHGGTGSEAQAQRHGLRGTGSEAQARHTRQRSASAAAHPPARLATLSSWPLTLTLTLALTLSSWPLTLTLTLILALALTLTLTLSRFE